MSTFVLGQEFWLSSFQERGSKLERVLPISSIPKGNYEMLRIGVKKCQSFQSQFSMSNHRNLSQFSY